MITPPEPNRSFRRQLFGWLVLAAILVFYLFTLRPGHRAGDFAMYLQHTANMAEGRAYAETTYFQNPAATSVGTKNYPPGLPVLLLPIYAIAGFNLTPMKVLMVFMFVGALVVFWYLTRDHLTTAFSTVMLVDIGFTPYLWASKDNVESDFPFLLLFYLSLWLASRIGARDRDSLRFLVLGVCMYAAVAIRSIGLVLPITLLLYDMLDGRRIVPGRRFWIPTAVLIVLMVVQSILLPLESGSYSSAFVQQVGSPMQLLDSMVRNAKFYILACAGRLLLSNGHGTLWADVLLLGSLAPFVVGIIARLRERIEMLDVAFVVYAGVLLVWPFRQPNYFIPLIPMLSFYVFFGLQWIAHRYFDRNASWIAAGACAVIVVTFGMNYATRDFGTIPHDVMSPASMDFYRVVEQEVPADAVILSRVPREVALFTRRRSTPPNLPGENRDRYTKEEEIQLYDYIHEVGVDFVAAGPRGPRFHREIIPLWELTESKQGVFKPTFSNEEWRLYAVSLEDATGAEDVRDD